MDLEPARVEVDQPRLGNARPGVERKLRPPIVGERAVRDLHQQADVGRLRMAGRVKVRPGREQHHVGLRLGLEPDQEQRISTPHDSPIEEADREQMLDPRDRRRVGAADRRHLDDLALDELDPVVLAEDAGLAHAVILIEREAPAPESDRHAVLVLSHSAPPPTTRQCREFDTPAIIGVLTPALACRSLRGPGRLSMADVRELTYGEAVKEAIAEEMRRDPRVFLIGEDVAEAGHPFKTLVGLVQEFGTERVIDTPISEPGYAGIGVGAAMTGMRPIVDVMFGDFITLTMDQMDNQAAKAHYMSGGKIKVPIVFRTTLGATRRSAAQHSQSLHAWVSHVPGLK